MATFRIYSWKWEEHVNMGKRSVSSPCKIVETCWNCRFCPPTRDGVKWQSLELDGIGGIRVFLCLGHVGHVEKGSCFFSTIPERFSDWPIQNRWPVMMFWQCNHPAFLAMSNLFKKKTWKFGSSVQMGQGSTCPFQWKSMETIWEFTECPWCLGCVFHGDWFPLSDCLRFTWVNAGLIVNMLVIVGYFTTLKVPFWILLITSPLFACSISVALGFCGIFSTICVCV